MTTATLRLCAAVLVAAAPAWSMAQTAPIKPGLWEVRSEPGADGKSASTPADRMQGLSPQVRAQVEAAMKQKGVALGAGGATRVCFTRESMDPARWGDTANCKTDYGMRTSSAWKWRSVCSQPEMTIDGEATFASPESYRVHTLTMRKRGTETRTTERTVQARWLGADCGDLKPFDPKR